MAKDPDPLMPDLSTERFEPPPPPAPELLRAVGEMKPVRTRTRFGAFAVVGLAALVWSGMLVLRQPLRKDLHALPSTWVAAGAVVWATAFLLALAAALVPRREDVFPAPGRASRVAGGAVAALALFALFATIEAPGLSVGFDNLPRSLLGSYLHCVGFVFEVAFVPLVAGLLVLRRLVPVGRARIGLAVGAAGGALGGLVLHFLCPIAESAHVLVSHVGGAALAAGLGAVLIAVALRR